MNDKDHQGSPDRFGYEWVSYSSILPESKRQLERWQADQNRRENADLDEAGMQIAYGNLVAFREQAQN